ncbi:Lactadherin [Stylophora pistillata]|uniref:Lactadherin n=1 Tax=Stylophora pistillata TaxID=50429 RepID=A0A2B4R5R0_STYPI|nr:Lactadherin [Stylophora pistillata]
MQKARRTSYNLAFKLKIVAEAEAVENNSEIAREYGISESMVRRWRKDQENLFNGEIKLSAKRKTMGCFTPKYPEMDQRLLEWFSEQRSQGNDDRNSEVKHVVYGVLTRFLRFLPQTHQGGVCMRLEVFGVEKASTCESEDIGLASGGTIPDSSFSASSYFNSAYKPSFGRLNGANRGWSPKTKTNLADFLQIDLLYEYVICAVATQGANGISEWTTNYKTQLSMDGITPVTYQETNVDKVFPGNSNQNGIVKNNLREFSSAKFIRFQPTTYHSWKSLRVEVYGVLLTKVPSQPPTAFNLTASSSTSITASWQLPPIFARHGRNITGFKLFYREKCFSGSFSFLNITSESTLSRLVTGLQKYTEYEFQVLAYSSDGDGPKSPVKVERTQGDGCVQNDLGMEGRNIPDSRITASSSRTPAENGRLNYVLGAPWCAETNDTSPYLQIDLQTLHIICAVSTQGNSKADQWVKNYTLQISTDGTTWTDYMEGGQVKFLRGNDDRSSEVKHVVYGLLTRYLRFLPQIHQGGVCMRTEVFGVKQKPRCYMEAIGVASSDTIPDSSFSALSEFNSVYAAKYGRLNGARSWAPMGINNANDYLQIDLLFEYVICAVATQGNPRTIEWTTKYKLRLAIEDTKFVTYQENSTDKVFAGNSDQNSVVKNSLQEFASAKFIRFQPTAFSGYKGLRVEVYGILLTKGCYMEAIGVASSDTIPDSSFSALSEFNSVYAAKYGRLNGARSWAPMGINNANDYLQIDLLFEYVICAVATQGNPRTIEWTTKYKLRLAIEDTKFVTYQENSTDKVFAGNSDQNSVVKNSLQEFASAKFIRVQPTAFSGYKGLRVEVYGILLTKVTGDLNLNRLRPEKPEGKLLLDLEVEKGFECLITKPTRIEKRGTIITESLIDVLLPNTLDCFQLSGNYHPCLSDHDLVYGLLKQKINHNKPKIITFRSYKSFDPEQYNQLSSSAPWHSGQLFDDVDDQAHVWNVLMKDILDEVAPVKRMHVRDKDLSYMMSHWRSAFRAKRKVNDKYLQKNSRKLGIKTQSQERGHQTMENSNTTVLE